ncbi:hypothetical protein MAR_003360 [Mya arenaria]|uniref:Uncharacterized protein n=1 Tax=Mya arenaria TaxID=6604 RepID=A0ABY7G775_MYAAR|nr:hypothetical protein MAR_003360 [Mya arenaria]
MPLRYSLALV